MTTVADMLKNEKYIGDCLFQKTYTGEQFKRYRNHGEKDQFYVEGHHEAIVSREVFEAAGRAIEQRKKEKEEREESEESESEESEESESEESEES